MRGLLRCFEATGESLYLTEATRRWETYKRYGMTENYANYNWFRRYDTWTEPCAVVDAFMVAAQLWALTDKAAYRDDAELIYYNAICMGQRHNGGFGLESPAGNALKSPCLQLHTEEATWCCSMRGGEGMGRAVEYTAFHKDHELAIPFLHDAEVTANLGGNQAFSVNIHTGYPFTTGAMVEVKSAPRDKVSLGLEKAEWMKDYSLWVNGRKVTFCEHDGLAVVKRQFRRGDRVEVYFKMEPRYTKMVNTENSNVGDFRVLYGPLLLAGKEDDNSNVKRGEKLIPAGQATFRGAESGTQLSSLYHLMDSSVTMSAKPPYSRRIIFSFSVVVTIQR